VEKPIDDARLAPLASSPPTEPPLRARCAIKRTVAVSAGAAAGVAAASAALGCYACRA